jgi:CO/xanthine dehydrogenase FAD-binding subunit
MTSSQFEYFAPDSIQEAIELLIEKGNHAHVMAGGTDLLLKIRRRILKPKAIISLNKIKGLKKISFNRKNGLLIGATALLADVASDKDILSHFPAIAYAAKNTANVQIRNMGTIAGNLCNASPSADNAPVLLAMNAQINVTGPDKETTIPLTSFFKGPGLTALRPAMIVTSVFVPIAPPNSGSSYTYLSARGKVDCSAVGVGAMVTLNGTQCTNAGIAMGACAPIPMRAYKAEELITGQNLSESLIQEVADQTVKEVMPITDVRASADYRRKIVAVLTKRALLQAWKSAVE